MIRPTSSTEELGGADVVDRQAREALALAEIGRAVSESERLDDLYQQVAASVRKLLPGDRVIIALVSPNTGELYREFVSGMIVGPTRTPSQLGRHGILDEIRESGDAARFDDIRGVLGRYPGVVNAVNSGIRSGIYAPLSLRGTVFGVLGADDRKPAAYTDGDLDLLCRIANQIDGSVESAKLQEQRAREVVERELIAEIGRAASSTLDLDVALDRTFEKLGRLLTVDRLAVAVRNEVTGTCDFAHAAGTPVRRRPGGTCDADRHQPAEQRFE